MRTFKRIGLHYLSCFFPKLFWQRYSRLARQLGLSRLYLILSFDCDTTEDMEAAAELDTWLYKHGIKRTYAVPGEQLRRGADIYRCLAEKGADFINHGALPHAEWREGRYWSINFYNRMSDKEVKTDIQNGHELVRQVTGKIPIGFRTPHFGFFQETGQLKMLYTVLRELNYRYSTSTIPHFGLSHGPVCNMNGFFEIPLSGSYPYFLNLLDSWGYIKNPFQPTVQDEYGKVFITTVRRLLALGIAGVLNYYVDPSHVYKSRAFLRAMEFVIEHKVPTLRYEELLDIVKEKREGYKPSHDEY